MKQTIESPGAEDAANVEAKRSWVRNHYDSEALHKYETVEGKLTLIDTILKNGWVSPTDTLKLQCLGITFGDALSQQVGLEWVAVEDEYGRDPALRLSGTTVLVFPMTSISKRVERGEIVDVYELFTSACRAVEDAAKRSMADSTSAPPGA